MLSVWEGSSLNHFFFLRQSVRMYFVNVCMYVQWVKHNTNIFWYWSHRINHFEWTGLAGWTWNSTWIGCICPSASLLSVQFGLGWCTPSFHISQARRARPEVINGQRKKVFRPDAMRNEFIAIYIFPYILTKPKPRNSLWLRWWLWPGLCVMEWMLVVEPRQGNNFFLDFGRISQISLLTLTYGRERERVVEESEERKSAINNFKDGSPLFLLRQQPSRGESIM